MTFRVQPGVGAAFRKGRARDHLRADLDPGFAIAEARCEINLVAVTRGGKVRKRR